MTDRRMRRGGATIRHAAGRLLVFAAALAAAWSAVTLLSGGFALHAGAARAVVARSARGRCSSRSSCSRPRGSLLGARGVRDAPSRRVAGDRRSASPARIAAAAASASLVVVDRVEHARRRRIGFFLLRAPGGGLRPRAGHADRPAAASVPPGRAAGRVRADRVRAVAARRRSRPCRSARPGSRSRWRRRVLVHRDAVFLVVPAVRGAAGLVHVRARPPAGRRR